MQAMRGVPRDQRQARTVAVHLATLALLTTCAQPTSQTFDLSIGRDFNSLRTRHQSGPEEAGGGGASRLAASGLLKAATT